MAQIHPFDNELDMVNYALTDMGEMVLDDLDIDGSDLKKDKIAQAVKYIKQLMFSRGVNVFDFANKALACAEEDDLHEQGSTWSVDGDYYVVTNVRLNPEHYHQLNQSVEWRMTDGNKIYTPKFLLANAPDGVDHDELLLADCNVEVEVALWPIEAIQAFLTIFKYYLSYPLKGASEPHDSIEHYVDKALAEVKSQSSRASSRWIGIKI